MIIPRARKRKAPSIDRLPSINRRSQEQIAAGATFLVALAAVALTVKLIRNRTQRAAESKLGLRTKADLADEVRRVGRNEIDATIAALSADEDVVSAHAVHDARKRIKRVRALLRLTRHDLGGKVFAAENDALRQVARRLSHARDSDVMVQTLDQITLTHAAEIPPGAFADLRNAVTTSAETERARLALHTSALRGAVAELSRLRARVAGWPLPEGATVADLKPGVRYVYKRGRAASDAAYAQPTTERLHQLRRRTKDVVNTVRLLDDPSPTARKIESKGRAVNKMLGEDHDLAVLRSGAQAHSETLAPEHLRLLEALIDRRRATLQREVTDQAATLYNRPTKKVVRRFIGGK